MGKQLELLGYNELSLYQTPKIELQLMAPEILSTESSGEYDWNSIGRMSAGIIMISVKRIANEDIDFRQSGFKVMENKESTPTSKATASKFWIPNYIWNHRLQSGQLTSFFFLRTNTRTKMKFLKWIQRFLYEPHRVLHYGIRKPGVRPNTPESGDQTIVGGNFELLNQKPKDHKNVYRQSIGIFFTAWPVTNNLLAISYEQVNWNKSEWSKWSTRRRTKRRRLLQ